LVEAQVKTYDGGAGLTAILNVNSCCRWNSGRSRAKVHTISVSFQIGGWYQLFYRHHSCQLPLLTNLKQREECTSSCGFNTFTTASHIYIYVEVCVSARVCLCHVKHVSTSKTNSNYSYCRYLLTPWSRVLIEKLTSLQLVKKFTAFLWNPEVLYRTHKCPPPVLILSQLHPFPTTPSNFMQIHLNIILPSTSGSPQWPLSLWLPTNTLCTHIASPIRATYPAHLILLCRYLPLY
jgi:hypothetical protein